MFNKRGQQSSFGMSFGMIFSIFLIIVFIATAIIVINVFLDFDKSANIGTFYSDLQSEINSAWRSSQTSKSFKLDLTKKIEMICFANLSAEVTGDSAIFDEISHYEYYDFNVFLLPPGEAGNLDAKTFEHLDIERITAESNPKCFKNPGKFTISKGLRSRLVMIS